MEGDEWKEPEDGEGKPEGPCSYHQRLVQVQLPFGLIDYYCRHSCVLGGEIPSK